MIKFFSGKGVAFFLILLLATIKDAQAYCAPATGSIIIQLITDAVVGGLAFVKIYWLKIKTLYNNLFRGGKGNTEPEDE